MLAILVIKNLAATTKISSKSVRLISENWRINRKSGIHRPIPFPVNLSLLVSCMTLAACGSGEVDRVNDGLSQVAPTQISMVAAGEFVSPGDGVASPDGSIFYFNAFTLDPEPRPGIFSVSSEGGAVTKLLAGEPLKRPSGLLMSCDGDVLYIADMGSDDETEPVGSNRGAIYTLEISSNNLTKMNVNGIDVPIGLAMDPDCSTIHATGFKQVSIGRKATGEEPAVVKFSTQGVSVNEGGSAEETLSGLPLVSPSGIFVDTDDVAWVMDQLADGDEVGGALFAIGADGAVTTVIVSGLRTGNPAGVSLTAGGVTAVIPELDEQGIARLTSINTQTGERSELSTPEIVVPGGIRTAREADIMVVVDTEGNAIYRAE